MLIELNRFMTTVEVRATYVVPDALADRILPALPVAFESSDGTRYHLESEVDEFFAEFVRRERRKAGTANRPATGRTSRKNGTLEIAIFANDLRRKGVIWKHVFKACKEKWPGDKRVENQEQVRKTWGRFFGTDQDEAD